MKASILGKSKTNNSVGSGGGVKVLAILDKVIRKVGWRKRFLFYCNQ